MTIGNNPAEGPGSIYLEGVGTIRHQSSKKGRHAKNWYLRMNYCGRRITVSLRTADFEEAKKKAKKEHNKIVEKYGRGEVIDGAAKRMKFEDLAEMIRADYKLKGNKSVEKLEDSINHLASYFGGVLALHIIKRKLVNYALERQENEGAAPSTVYVELQIMRRMFSLANDDETGFTHFPKFPVFKLNNARQGFFEKEEFQAVAKHLDEDVRPIAEFAYFTGWRKSEVLNLEWKKNVDMKVGTVRLEPGTTKNDEGREFPFGVFPALRDLMVHQREKADDIEQKTGMKVTHVFFRSSGQPVKSFKAAWAKATEKAGLTNRIFHDFRRTAARNLIDAGVSETDAMKITGHLTATIFKRYCITNKKHTAESVSKLAKFFGQDPIQPQPTQPEPPKEEPIIEEEKVAAAGGGGVVINFQRR